MEKQQILDKTREVMTPFETGNIITFMKNLSLKSVMENPWLISLFIIIFFYAVIKRSKPVLGFLFVIISCSILVRYTLPVQDSNDLSISSMLPFAFGGLLIGGVLIYFIFIKSE